MKTILILCLLLITIVLIIINIKISKKLITLSKLEKRNTKLRQNYKETCVETLEKLEIFKDVSQREVDEMFLSNNAYKAADEIIRYSSRKDHTNVELLQELLSIYERYENSRTVSQILKDRGN